MLFGKVKNSLFFLEGGGEQCLKSADFFSAPVALHIAEPAANISDKDKNAIPQKVCPNLDLCAQGYFDSRGDHLHCVELEPNEHAQMPTLTPLSFLSQA